MRLSVVFGTLLLICFFYQVQAQFSKIQLPALKKGFASPPDESRPGVYWYFMDGNLSKDGMTRDLEAMKNVSIGTVLFLEVNAGIPRGKVDFLSAEWKQLFVHAVHECERLGMSMVLGIGPGWNGSGGPWVKAEESMQHLVSSSINISGGNKLHILLPVPKPKTPFFGEEVLSDDLRKQRDHFYEDVKVLAFPMIDTSDRIKDVDEKALYYRPPYTSQPGVRQYIAPELNGQNSPSSAIQKDAVIDLTNQLKSDGTLDWNAPPGKWTIMRFGRRNNGSVTRPAPIPGLGFESDKLDTTAISHHLANFTDKLLDEIGIRKKDLKIGLTTLHIDSWEMGAQNWTVHFSEEFRKRRGYDPTPFLPAYAGYIIESREISERFLWDVRQTVQELILSNHAGFVKQYGHRNGLQLSIEPYDLNPSADLELGAVADIPMGEFWSNTYNSAFSCIEAASIAHVDGKAVVGAESFTGFDGYQQYPGSMKNRGDWAFASGINKFFFHTYVHQPFESSLRPGMTMGTIGIQWNRNQTWWPMAGAYHQYISRCQFLLQQGRPVADILYLTPEGAPMAFRAPASAFTGNDSMPDRRGYNFDGCSPTQLYTASVVNGKVVFPGGASYELLVMPSFETITPALLTKIKSLVAEGATVTGSPSIKSPSLTNYPSCDNEVQSISRELWGSTDIPDQQTIHQYGKGKIIWGGNASRNIDNLYPDYATTAAIVLSNGIVQDVEADSIIRYTHRQSDDWDMYFVSNRTNQTVKRTCLFRSAKGAPILWNAVSGETRPLPEYSEKNGRTKILLEFNAYESFFIVFTNEKQQPSFVKRNFPQLSILKKIDGPWNVTFDTSLGGPGNVVFDRLQDWSLHAQTGIRYYSGIARYSKTFQLTKIPAKEAAITLDLGEVNAMARVRLNGTDLGIVWTNPMRVDITKAAKEGNNQLEIEVANLWTNRLIGDEQFPYDGPQKGQWPEWLMKHKPRTSGRISFTTYGGYSKESPLLKSGLLGPVTVRVAKY